MKKILLLICIVSFSVSIVYAQACGKSVRTITLEYKPNEKPPKKVSYELFYLAPKEDGSKFNDYEKMSKFLTDFLGDSTKGEHFFWAGYGDGNPFVNVPTEKAENYIKNYNVKDFSSYYTNQWHDNHLSQLKGRFVNGVLKLETRETDITPFIMRIKAKNYETLYLLSSFLGGCFNNGEKQTIQMNQTKK
jgi:hypothetical protein